MTIKVFLSYAHQDSQFKETLQEHLTMLKRNKIIETWNDRDISPGSNWESDIKKHLDNANVILCLVSSSFLASNYCYCKEFEYSLEKHNEGKCIIVPIIIRDCDWADSPLGKIQGLPTDAKAVKLWDDHDTAWKDVVNGLKKLIDELKKKNINICDETLRANNFSDFLEDTSIPLYDRNNNQITLKDIYIVPNFKIMDCDSLSNKNDAVNLLEKGLFLVFGDEQVGKTSLLKWIFRNKLKKNNVLYIDFMDLKSLKDPEKVIKNKCFELYGDESTCNLDLVLLDNFDKSIGVNLKSKNKFITYINSKFDHIIVTFNNSNYYFKEELDCFNNYIEISIRNFGYNKREELIKKWYSLGVEDTIPEDELYKRVDEAKGKIDSILLKNIVPPKPSYILLLLRLLDSNPTLEITSYGHCYQQLIYQSFDKVNIDKSEFDKYINVLKEFSWALLIKNKALNNEELNEFFNAYEKEYLSVNQRTIVQKLISAHIIVYNEDLEYNFKYPYIYYFFIGKKISDSYLNSNEVQNKANEFFNKMYREDYANILVFISHHTREPWITEKIVDKLKSVFTELDEATLEMDTLLFMKSFYSNIGKIIIEHKNDISENRKKINEKLDELEEEYKINKKHEDEYDHPQLFKNIQNLFKGLEIVGQIVRNRHSSLKKSELSFLIKESIFSGLRFLHYFIQVSDITKNRAVDMIQGMINDNNMTYNMTDKEIRSKVEYLYLSITYRIIFSILKQIGLSIGSKEAKEIYTNILKDNPTVAMKLIHEDILLTFSKSLNIARIKELNQSFEKNMIAQLILKQLIVYHFEIFPVEYKEKQKIADLLGLDLRKVNLLERKKVKC